MKSEEFKTEILDYVGKCYDEFCSYQNLLQSMFRIFHEVCIKNDIHYYYGFGSLLGVVRDNGMIPWDADIDVLIPINQVERMIECFNRDLPSDYYLISNFSEKNYYLCEMRMCKKGYNPEYLHIDVFYLIGAPRNEKQLEKFDKRVRNMYYFRALRYQPLEKGKESREKLVYYAKKAIRFLLKIVPDAVFNKVCNTMLFQYDYSDAEKCIVWATGGEIFPISIFEPAKTYFGESYECLIPNDSDAFLSIRYGKYMEYLPTNKRFEEFYYWYKQLRKVRD